MQEILSPVGRLRPNIADACLAERTNLSEERQRQLVDSGEAEGPVDEERSAEAMAIADWRWKRLQPWRSHHEREVTSQGPA